MEGGMNGAVFAMLGGRWRFARQIAPDGVAVRGAASFAPEGPAAWAYTESGHLILPDGREGAAMRRYRYRLDPAGLHIDFADGPDAGRLFVTLRFRPGAEGWVEAAASHACQADTYAVHVRVRPPDNLVSTITASGPHKGYCATTRYARAGRRVTGGGTGQIDAASSVLRLPKAGGMA